VSALCIFLLGIIATVAALVAFVNVLVSKFLSGKPWWENLDGLVKRIVMFALAVLLAVGVWLLARFIQCEGVPELQAVVELIMGAALLYFFGKAQYERRQRSKAEEAPGGPRR